MARSLPPKTVQCYHCDHRFEVGGRAQSTSCPGCNKPVMVADQVIDKQRGPIRELKTCGKIIVKKRGRLICHHVVAHNGLECEGIVDAQTVVSRTPVTLGKKSTFKGDLTAPAIDIAEGAKIRPSRFAIGRPIGEDDEDNPTPPSTMPDESPPPAEDPAP
ncbi:MAG: polymer-forming cytoskeletal protein [Planctomycetota bacterium]